VVTAIPSRIYLWRYRENRRNYPGYHLTADACGCDDLGSVLTKHENATHVRRTRLALSPVTPSILAVPANTRGDSTVVTFSSLELVTDPNSPRDHFRFTETHPHCQLDLSTAQAGCVLEGVRDIQHGKGDYCVGGAGDHVIWFWWFPHP
jgi:hypothetical protein